MKFQKQKLLQQQQEKLDESKKLAKEKNDSRSVWKTLPNSNRIFNT